MDSPRIRKYGTGAILMEWEARISPEINEEVVTTATFLKDQYSQFIQEVVPSYQSLVIFLKEGVDLDHYIALLRSGKIAPNHSKVESKIWRVPVCYELVFGLDLENVADSANVSIETLIDLHCAPDYRIYSIGFLPGFLYLGGLNERIFTPRKQTINRFAPKGSVAIGGEQTGIYPQESPGGWNIIGRTPIELFDVNADAPTPFSVGDSIRFQRINREEFDRISTEILFGSYQLNTISND